MVTAHGNSKYTNDGCRCDECTDAHRLAIAGRKRARRKYVAEFGLPSGVEHGNSAYKNWSCRCAVCKAAHATRRNAARRRQALR
jgi:hypothetical protein